MGIHPDEFDDGIVQRELNRAEFRGPDESATLTSTPESTPRTTSSATPSTAPASTTGSATALKTPAP